MGGAKGYTSNEFTSADVAANPVWVEIDLGADTDLDAVRLFPRTDIATAGGGTADFPADFTFQTRRDGGTSYTTARTVTGQANPAGAAQTYTLTAATGRLRLQTARLGTPASDESGKWRRQLAEVLVR
ncbi:discoidin domain-containing protein [Streptomyces sp. NPDC001315]|uniref:discoidin domain-containing protein n=1 Tax=Streptomyces sp. NPDC001315 TaxID=3364562 RepID=UPI0036C3E84C